MSDVISFRLKKDNPRESQALEILKGRCADGYSIRQIITEALIKLNGSDLETDFVTLDGLTETLSQVCLLLEKIGSEDVSSVKAHNGNTRFGLPDNFITSIMDAAKPGLRLDQT